MYATDKTLTELLAEARAIRFALECKTISYTEAKNRVKPLLEKLNKAGIRIAKKYGVKYKKVTFQNLGSNF